MQNRKITVFFLLLLSISINLFSEESTNNVYHTVLKNGLEIFILENYDTPLVYIELAFKAGGNYQTSENEGIFHLYDRAWRQTQCLYHQACRF
jgi:predicted Zn-dependent peptidase